MSKRTSRSRPAARAIAILSAAALLAAVGAAPAATAEPPSSPGPAAAVSKDPTGLDLDALHGKVVLLDFWASWCTPCAKSFPWLSSLQTRHQDDGLVVIGVDVDKDRSAADAFLRRHSPTFRIVFDPKGKLAEQYDLKGMPSSFLIGRDGTRRLDHVGFRDSDVEKLEAQIGTLLAEKAGTEAEKEATN